MNCFCNVAFVSIVASLFIACGNEVHKDKKHEAVVEQKSGFFAEYDVKKSAYLPMKWEEASEYCMKNSGRLPTKNEAKKAISFTKIKGWVDSDVGHTFWTSEDCSINSFLLNSKCIVKVENSGNTAITPAEKHNDTNISAFCVKDSKIS